MTPDQRDRMVEAFADSASTTLITRAVSVGGPWSALAVTELQSAGREVARSIAQLVILMLEAGEIGGAP